MVLVAVSGGRDSMVLAEKVRREGGPFAIAHCNFRLRGDESDADEPTYTLVLSDDEEAFANLAFGGNKTRKLEFLVADALAKNVPILGLCRGMFMINGFFGGKVLRGASHSKPRHDHYVRFTTGHRALVNTYHNSAVPRDLLADNLEEIAVEEGTDNIEAFRAKESRVLGLQWHPERPLPSREAETASVQLLNWLLHGAELPDKIRPQR